jgi:hypothetical protein
MNKLKSLLAAFALLLAAPAAFAQSCTSNTNLGMLSTNFTSFGNWFYSAQTFNDCYSFRLGSTSDVQGLTAELDLSIRFDVDITSVTLIGGNLGSGRSLTASTGEFEFDNLAAGVYSLIVSGDVSRVARWGTGLGVGYFGAIAATPATIAAPVPEPETYAMLAMGLGLVTWITRRRQAAAA